MNQMPRKQWHAQVDLRHIDEVVGSNVVEIGMDLSEFYMSVEWDILEVPAVRYTHRCQVSALIKQPFMQINIKFIIWHLRVRLYK